MQRVTRVVRRQAVRAHDPRETITLDHQARYRRRIALKADGGMPFLLDLDRAMMLEDGDALQLEDGTLVVIRAAAEDLIEVRTEDSLRLTKLAWHLGNRHVPTEITPAALYIAHDHVLLEMLRGLGASTSNVKRPFKPERGAYHEHGHDNHDHTHD
jgi:urease accessory protein